MSNDIDSIIKELEELAAEVLQLKKTSIPRRPIVIEFCGSPKAGKTSCISSLAMFLRRNDFRVKVLVERASVCPVISKYDPLFNIWTVCSAVAELSEILSNSPKDYDVVIMDRGLFDALCWFEWQHEHQHLDNDSLERIVSFLTLKKWQSTIDLVLAFVAKSETSIDREYASLLTRKRGSIMREPTLESYMNTIYRVAREKQGVFRRVEIFDTTHKDQNTVSYEVTKQLLGILRESTAESVGYISLDKFVGKPFGGIVEFTSELLPAGNCVEFAARTLVEANESVVQPIPVVVITDKLRTCVLAAKKNRKAARDSSPEYNKTLLYFGGHTRLEDSFASDAKDVMTICKAAITRELKEETGIDFYPENLFPQYLIWEKDNDRSKRHLAICFVWEADPETLQIRLDRNEFSVSGPTTNHFLDINEVLSEPLESWSKAILRKVFSTYVDQSTLQLEFGQD